MRAYNETKRLVLAHLERAGWQSVREIQVVMGWRSTTRAYDYLRTFRSWQLLSARTIPRLEYRLTAKGRVRLAWLTRHGM
ncbi:MAG: hypothetical protein WBE86_05325 [Candidatus Acidiferrales bacterium]